MTYIQQVLRVIVAQICQTIGWHSIQTTPLELLVDILHKYLQEITRDAYRFTELYNRNEPNLDDIALCFRNLNINLSEIEEYINYVQPISCPIDIPKFPVHKDSNLNFLKPGSDEVLTRPVHVNEYLPPIFPEKEIKHLSEHDFDQEILCETKESTILLNGKQNSENDDTIFKKPELHDSNATNGNLASLLSLASSSSASNFNGTKKSRLFEEEGRPTREMSSVMMTSSGFISPAREGKLPDSKPPILPEYRPARTPSPKLSSNINSANDNTDIKNPALSSVLANNSNIQTTPPSNNQNILNQDNKKDISNLIDSKLLKKLKKKSLIDKEQRKLDKLAGKLASSTTKPLSKNKLLKQFQKQQQQQLLQQQQQQFKSKYNITKEKLTKKQKQKLKQQREFNMMHHTSILKNLTPLQKHSKNLNYSNNNMKDAITLLQQSAAIAAATGIPLAEIHQSSTTSQQQQQFLLNQQQNFSQNLSSNNNRFGADIKLNTEPDKNKLNIFKKISSTSSTTGIKKEPKDDIKSEQQQLISLPSGTTITPTNNFNNNQHLSVNNDKKYPIINDPNQIICVEDDDKINSSLPSSVSGQFLQLQQQIQSNNNSGGSSDNNRLNIEQQLKSHQPTSKLPKKLKKKFLQNEEQPLNLSNDKLLFNNNNNSILENLTFKQQQQLLKDNYLLKQQIQQNQQLAKTAIKEKKERIKKAKIKETKMKNTTSSTVAQQFLQAVTAAAAVAASAGPNSNPNNLLYPPDIRSSDNLAAINKKLMKIDTIMQPTTTSMNKLLSPDDLNKINQQQKSSTNNNVNAAAAAAAANFFSKQYLSGGPMGSYIPQLFPFPLSFQPRPGLIPTPGLFPPIPPPPSSSQSSIPSTSNISGSMSDNPPGFNEYLSFPNNLMGNNLNIDSKIDNTTSLPLNNNKIINNYTDNKNDINLMNKILPPSIPQFLENKNYSNVAPLVPESMIQNYQLTKTKQPRFNKQQQQQFIPSNLLPNSSLPSASTNLDFNNKNLNQSLPINKFSNNDIPIEISDDEKIKSDDDNNQIKNSNIITKDQLLLKTVNSELIDEQNQQSDKINDKKFNLSENRDNNDILSSDHDGDFNTDYTTGGSGTGGIISKFDKQQRKEHKKGKKFKDGKIKKKKDKKDKLKNKEKYDKKQRIKDELYSINRKDKEKSKKLKKEKKKDKQRLATSSMNPLLQGSLQFNDFNKISNDNNNDDSSAGDNTPQSAATTTSSSSTSSSAVPKLTLKLGIGKSPTPDSIESRKIVIKPQIEQQQLTIGTGQLDYNYRRDPSPELARISPLVTRPPKQKSKEKDKNNEIESPSSVTAASSSSGHYFPNISGNSTNPSTSNTSNLPSISGLLAQPASNHLNPVASRGPGRPKGSGTKNANITLNPIHHSSGIGGIGSTIVSGLDLNDQQKTIHPAITSSTSQQPPTLLNTTDAEGNQVWICPACGRVDDGTPMIGCDGCDAWYHWVCVGIQVPPDDNEDWYCRVCITKKQDVYESDKKKKRKKKNKTN